MAEDEDLVRNLALHVLASNGYRTIAAKDGAEAVALFKQHIDEIDAVLLDLTMPVLSGGDVLVELHRLRPDLPVIITSGYNQSGAPQLSQANHHVRFLQKPYRTQKLLTEIREALARPVALGGEPERSC